MTFGFVNWRACRASSPRHLFGSWPRLRNLLQYSISYYYSSSLFDQTKQANKQANKQTKLLHEATNITCPLLVVDTCVLMIASATQQVM